MSASDEQMRARWNTIYVDGGTWVEDCGCSTSEAEWRMCSEHWDSFNKQLDEPDDPKALEGLRALHKRVNR